MHEPGRGPRRADSVEQEDEPRVLPRLAMARGADLEGVERRAEEYGVRGFDSDTDTDTGLHQGGRVVDAVADHGDDASALVVQAAQKGDLGGRQRLGMEARDAEDGRGRLGRPPVAPRHHQREERGRLDKTAEPGGIQDAEILRELAEGAHQCGRRVNLSRLPCVPASGERRHFWIRLLP